MHHIVKELKCLDVQSWRAFTKEEMCVYLEDVYAKHNNNRERPAVLVVRQQLSPVDAYCYLKARFGAPNGFQTFLRKDDSDNWIHWDFNLKAGDEDICVCGTCREVQFMISESLTDEDWRDLILKVKADYGRVGREKSAVLRSLEKWVLFPNKFVQIATVCADLHAKIVDNLGGRPTFKWSSSEEVKKQTERFKELTRRSSSLYKHCLELALLTPVLAEAFINMAILILCKKEIRNNKRQLEAFIRSQIDAKVFDLPYKCEGFTTTINQSTATYKSFKRVMDKRNQAIHGNIDPEREQVEVVYFEGNRPLFKESGDHIGKRFEALERQYEPDSVIKDYEDTYAFLGSIVACLRPGLKKDFWLIMEDSFPGYDVDRKKTGRLLPDAVITGHIEGVRYDDELNVTWPTTT